MPERLVLDGLAFAALDLVKWPSEAIMVDGTLFCDQKRNYENRKVLDAPTPRIRRTHLGISTPNVWKDMAGLLLPNCRRLTEIQYPPKYPIWVIKKKFRSKSHFFFLRARWYKSTEKWQ